MSCIIYIYIHHIFLRSWARASPLRPIHCTGHAVLESSDIASIAWSADRDHVGELHIVWQSVWVFGSPKAAIHNCKSFWSKTVSINASGVSFKTSSCWGPEPLATLFSTLADHHPNVGNHHVPSLWIRVNFSIACQEALKNVHLGDKFWVSGHQKSSLINIHKIH